MLTRRELLWVGAALPLVAQDKSVRPGINDNFKNPNVDEWIGRLETESRESFTKRKEIIDAIGIKPGDVIADIGAGTGVFTSLLASKTGEKGHVYALDISTNFLQHISDVAAKQGFHNITTVLGRQDEVTLAPNLADIVYVCDTYHHFEFPQKTLASIARVMKPNGRFVLVEMHKQGERTEHVRAPRDMVEKEIAAAGFKKAMEPSIGLKENYMLVFRKG